MIASYRRAIHRIDEQKFKELEIKIKEENESNEEEIENEIATLKIREDEMRNKWEEEKDSNDKINQKKEELEKAKFDLETAENNYDLENAAKLRHGIIPNLEGELDRLREETKSQILSDVVDEEEIAEYIIENPNEVVVEFPIISDIQLDEKLPFFKSLSMKLASL